VLRPVAGGAGSAGTVADQPIRATGRSYSIMLRERLPGLMAVSLLAALVMTTWWAADYTQRSVALDPPRRMTHEPDAWARNFIMLRSDTQGLAIHRMEGEVMLHYPDDDSTEITQARATGRQAQAPVTIATADLAVMDQDGDRVVMRGNAHVHRNADVQTPAMQIRSDVLTLLVPEDVVVTDAPAVVVRAHSVMRGTGMHYDNKTKILQVLSAADTRIAGQDQRAGARATPVSRIEPSP